MTDLELYLFFILVIFSELVILWQLYYATKAQKHQNPQNSLLFYSRIRVNPFYKSVPLVAIFDRQLPQLMNPGTVPYTPPIRFAAV